MTLIKHTRSHGCWGSWRNKTSRSSTDHEGLRRIPALTSKLSSKQALNIQLDFSSQWAYNDSPVVRTNPVTGWKSLYGAGVSARDGSIHGVTKYENDILREYCKSRCSLSQHIWGTNTQIPSRQAYFSESRPPGPLQVGVGRPCYLG